MGFPILNNGRSLFLILGLLGGIFHFINNFKTAFSKQTANTLYTLSMSYNKDIMFIWVNAKSLSIGF